MLGLIHGLIGQIDERIGFAAVIWKEVDAFRLINITRQYIENLMRQFEIMVFLTRMFHEFA